MSISVLEFAWVSINTITLVLTLTALSDALADREAVRLINGKARELAANGIVRREIIRSIVQILLLFVAAPSLFLADGESRSQGLLIATIAALMAVPVALFVSSFLDARDRKQMTVLVVAEALTIKTDAFARIEAALARNTEISQAASDHADAAYHEANSVNEKIRVQGDQIIAMTERAEREDVS